MVEGNLIVHFRNKRIVAIPRFVQAAIVVITLGVIVLVLLQGVEFSRSTPLPEARDLHYFIVLDASKRMNTGFADGETKWITAQAALKSLLNSTLPERANYGLLVFGGDPSVSEPCCDQQLHVLVPLGFDSRSKVLSAVENLEPYGTGSFCDAIAYARNALLELPRDQEKAIVIITGGGDACASPDGDWVSVSKLFEVSSELMQIYAEIVILAGEQVDERIEEFVLYTHTIENVKAEAPSNIENVQEAVSNVEHRLVDRAQRKNPSAVAAQKTSAASTPRPDLISAVVLTPLSGATAILTSLLDARAPTAVQQPNSESSSMISRTATSTPLFILQYTATPTPPFISPYTATPTPAFAPASTSTFTPVPSSVDTATATPTMSFTPTPSSTPTSALTPSPVPLPSPTSTFTPPPTATPASTPTPTFTPTPTPTFTPTPTPYVRFLNLTSDQEVATNFDCEFTLQGEYFGGESLRISVFTDVWYPQPDVTLQGDGTWQSLVFLSGRCDNRFNHKVKAELLDAGQNVVATYQVDVVERTVECSQLWRHDSAIVCKVEEEYADNDIIYLLEPDYWCFVSPDSLLIEAKNHGPGSGTIESISIGNLASTTMHTRTECILSINKSLREQLGIDESEMEKPVLERTRYDVSLTPLE